MRTRVGYAGGSSHDPSYHAMGDHSETLQIDYDPRVLDYETLLERFWDSHDPTRAPWSRQYRTAIFYAGAEQESAAKASLQRQAQRRAAPLGTVVEPLDRFYLAEPYHQKYTLRRHGALLAALGLGDDELVASTVAARLNGWLLGYGDAAAVEREQSALGLTDETLNYVLKHLRRRR